ncbi:MAG: hypothetical protein ABI920_15495 [Casimicrobiaceae bacterium]
MRPPRPSLTEAEARNIESRVAAVEAATGVQVVCAVHARADSYPEAPWRAFAMGTVMTALAAFATDVARPDWVAAGTVQLALLALLGVGLAAAAATIVFPSWARLFIGGPRLVVEVDERARALFVTAGLARTPGSHAVLVFTSLFERRVAIVADRAFDTRVAAEDWQAVVAAMGRLLAAGDTERALVAGLDVLVARLSSAGFVAGASQVATDTLPNVMLEARGRA